MLKQDKIAIETELESAAVKQIGKWFLQVFLILKWKAKV